MAVGKPKLSADDWCAAALNVVAESGVDAVAVEPLARRLGVTKGSFYWHFSSRDALLKAALTRWELHVTDEVVARVEDETDPRMRIRKLFREVDGSEHASRLHLALAANTHDPEIRQVVQRVSRRQLQFLNECYRALGLEAGQARHYATLAYSAYLGTMQLRRDAPETLPHGDALHVYLDFVNASLIPPNEQPEPTHNLSSCIR